MEPAAQGVGNFWRIVTEVWREGAFGIDIGLIVVALVIFAAFFLLRGLFTRFVIRRLKAWTARTRTEIDDRVIEALERPVRFIPIVIGVYFAIEFLSLSGPLALVADRLIRSLIAYNIFWLFYRLVDPLSFMLKGLEALFTAVMVDWLVKAIKVAIAFIGTATILEIWGIEVAPIIAGLGLLGVAIALGAQDLFKNLIAGILVISEKRFEAGDWIRVDDVVEGNVERIGFRSSMIRRFDKAPVYVPNAKLSENALTNFTQMSHRRIYWTVGVEYRTTIDQLRRIRDEIESFILESPDFAHPPEVATFVRIDKFSDSSIDILVYCFTVTTVWGEWLACKERLAYRIKEVVEAAGTGFAFPSRSLYVESLPEGVPETFVPPNRDG